MFDKLFEAQQKAEEAKKRLDHIGLSAVVENGAIKIDATASKKITAVQIDDEFLKQADKEELEELLVTVINKVLAQAESVAQTEMAAVTKEMMGGMGALGNLFGNK
jgi:DNA-binding protein YbaB